MKVKNEYKDFMAHSFVTSMLEHCYNKMEIFKKNQKSVRNFIIFIFTKLDLQTFYLHCQTKTFSKNITILNKKSLIKEYVKNCPIYLLNFN